MWTNLVVDSLPVIYRLFVEFSLNPQVEIQFKLPVKKKSLSSFKNIEYRKDQGLVIIRGDTITSCTDTIGKIYVPEKTDWNVIQETTVGDMHQVNSDPFVSRILGVNNDLANIVLFDTEFYREPGTDQRSIAEIAAIKDTVRPIQKFSAITKEGVAHSTFTKQEVDRAISEKDALFKFICFCYDTEEPQKVVKTKKLILVAHNGRVTDYNVLQNRLKKYGFDWFDLRSVICLDSKDVFDDGVSSWSIDSLLQKEFGRKEIHRALSDTVDMYDLLVKKLGYDVVRPSVQHGTSIPKHFTSVWNS